jgi:hypothetical protein
MEPAEPSHVLNDLFEYATLASIASTDIPQADGKSTKPCYCCLSIGIDEIMLAKM